MRLPLRLLGCIFFLWGCLGILGLGRTPLLSSEQSSPISDSNPVGTLPGNFQVTERGGAQYSIPLEIPPGTAGMSPVLSLSYNSQQSNGWVGMGFSLQGIGSISRVASNLTQNGRIQAVAYDRSDRFALNGEQLVGVKGTYGTDGAEYRAYSDPTLKVESVGGQGNGPQFFRVYSKNGQMAEYGGFKEARLTEHGKEDEMVMMWGLSRLQDASHNYYEIHYQVDAVNHQLYPSQILYTGNKAAAVLPFNEVKFLYEPRPDIETRYQSGVKFLVNQRLRAIEVYAEGMLVSRYECRYEEGKETGRSRLVEIKRCDGHGICLQPTRFSWKKETMGWENVSRDYAPPQFFIDDWGKDKGVRFADINGNGLLDMEVNTYFNKTPFKAAWINDGTHWVRVDSKWAAPIFFTDGDSRDKGVRLIDFSGDGYRDILVHSIFGNGIRISKAWQFTSEGWIERPEYAPPKPITNGYSDNGFRLIDLTGNGMADIVQNNGLNINEAYINNGKKWESAPLYRSPISLMDNEPDEAVFLDLNGDGLVDLLQIPKNWVEKFPHGVSHAYLNRGNGWQKDDRYALPKEVFLPDEKYPDRMNPTTGRHENTHPEKIEMMDLNGDGLEEVVVYHCNRIHSVFWNTGKGFVRDASWGLDFGGEIEELMGVDLNGDRRMDLLVKTPMQGIKAFINTGKGWKRSPEYDLKQTDLELSQMRWVDLSGHGLQDIIQGKQHHSYAYRNRLNHPDLLETIENGLGEKTSMVYQSLVGSTVYTKEHDAHYPLVDMQVPWYVVSETKTDTGVVVNQEEKTHRTRYHYTGAKYHRLGFGFLGFHKVRKTDEETGIWQETFYGQDPTHYNMGLILKESTGREDLKWMETLYDWQTKRFEGNDHQFYYMTSLSHQLKKIFSEDGTLLKTRSVATVFDEIGNPTELREVLIGKGEDQHTVITKNTFTNDFEHWYLGQLVQAKVTYVTQNLPENKSETSFEYDPETGQLKASIREPNNAESYLKEAYLYDAFGNVIQTRWTDAHQKERMERKRYDEKGRFVIEKINAMGHRFQQEWIPSFGVLKKTIDPNGLQTEYQYDGFGRMILQKSPGDIFTAHRLEWVGLHEIPDKLDAFKTALYREIIESEGKGTVALYYDKLTRTIGKSQTGFNGSTLWQWTRFDTLGRPIQQSLPFYTQDLVGVIQFEYDERGRMTRKIDANGAITRTVYEGDSTKIIDDQGHTTTTLKNVRELPIKIWDTEHHLTEKTYDSKGRLTEVKDAENHLISYQYDRLNHVIRQTDEDRGEQTFVYDAWGQLVQIKDAKGSVVQYDYDALGRMVSRQIGNVMQSLEYDKVPFGIGKLSKEISVDSTQASLLLEAEKNGMAAYERQFQYDSLSRLLKTSTRLHDLSYEEVTDYDALGRINLYRFPDGTQMHYHYDAQGFLKEIDDDSLHPYWRIQSMNAMGEVTEALLGEGLKEERVFDVLNHMTRMMVMDFSHDPSSSVPKVAQFYQYDRMGRLTTRTDESGGEELFEYDDLNRLMHWKKGEALHRYRYDAIGNMTYQSDVGDYTYGEKGRLPHAVTAIKSDTHHAAYVYDETGAQIKSVVDGKQREIAYNAFGQPILIHSEKGSVLFQYDVRGTLLLREDHTGPQKTTRLLLNGYEERIIDDGTRLQKEIRHEIGPHTLTITKDNQTETFQQIKDNHGSVVALIDASNQIVERKQYTPFGLELDPKKSLFGLYRGFNDMETISDEHLIHMNGRLYDPELGRFLSPDVNDTQFGNGQGINRYSYCLNNPLSYTDPTGYSFLGDFFGGFLEMFRDVFSNRLMRQTLEMGVGIYAFGHPIAGFSSWSSAAFATTAFRAVSTSIVSGNIEEGLKTIPLSMVQAYGWHQVGDTLNAFKWGNPLGKKFGDSLVHGLAGGGFQVLQGGNFRDGFLVNAVSEMANECIEPTLNFSSLSTTIAARSITSGLIGGSVAALTGFNFINGAETAFYAEMFNDLAHSFEFTRSYQSVDELRNSLQSNQVVVGERCINLLCPLHMEWESGWTQERSANLKHTHLFYKDGKGEFIDSGYGNEGPFGDDLTKMFSHYKFTEVYNLKMPKECLQQEGFGPKDYVFYLGLREGQLTFHHNCFDFAKAAMNCAEHYQEMTHGG